MDNEGFTGEAAAGGHPNSQPVLMDSSADETEKSSPSLRFRRSASLSNSGDRSPEPRTESFRLSTSSDKVNYLGQGQEKRLSSDEARVLEILSTDSSDREPHTPSAVSGENNDSEADDLFSTRAFHSVSPDSNSFKEFPSSSPFERDEHVKHSEPIDPYLSENSVVNPFSDSDHRYGRTAPPEQTSPTSTGSGNFFSDNNTSESFDMVTFSPVAPPRQKRNVLGQTEFQDHTPELQDLNSKYFEFQDIHLDSEDGFSKKDVMQSTTAPLNEHGKGGPGGDKGGACCESGPDVEAAEEVVDADQSVAVEEEDPQPSLSPVRQLLSLWYVAVIVLTPIVLLPLPLVIDTQEAKCAYVIFVMAVFWVTEAIPIPVTSLMPIFLLPMMGLLTARTVSAAYINDTSILFLGGLTVAIAIERWNLHRRIALAVMMVVGAEPRWLMLGMMAVTWFLSMWISNTATTAMMLPIVQAVLDQIGDTRRSDEASETLPVDSPDGTDRQKRSFKDKILRRGKRDFEAKGRTDKTTPKQMSIKKLSKALSLAIAYSANVGGIASLTGTGPNLVLLGQSQIIFEDYGLSTPITFATWLVYGLPLSFLLVIVVWIWLQICFLRCKGGCDCIFKRGSKSDGNRRADKVKAVIKEEFRKLGPVTYAEGTIIVFFAILVVLWITRDLGGAGGWGTIFQQGFVSDSTPAILTAVLMFVLPSALPDILFRSRRQGKGPRRPLTALMDWKTLHEKMPWSLYLLLGGGFAIARAAQDSGLSLWLGQKLAVFGALDPWLMLLVICYIVTFATEVTSNTAIATLMMPILAQLSLTLNLNPLFFMFPAAITTSFAFMLPVATPPNAIVFAFGAVRVVDMVLCGFILNLISVPFLLLATVTWGNAFFQFDVLPPEFVQNVTSAAAADGTVV